MDDIATLTGGTVIRDEPGLALDKVGNEVLGSAAKVVLTKDSTTIVGDGSTQEAVERRVSQIWSLIEDHQPICQEKIGMVIMKTNWPLNGSKTEYKVVKGFSLQKRYLKF